MCILTIICTTFLFLTYIYFKNNKINNIVNNNNNIDNNLTDNKHWYKHAIHKTMLKRRSKHKDKAIFGLMCNAHCLTIGPVAFMSEGSLASVQIAYLAHPMADLMPANWGNSLHAPTRAL